MTDEQKAVVDKLRRYDGTYTMHDRKDNERKAAETIEELAAELEQANNGLNCDGYVYRGEGVARCCRCGGRVRLRRERPVSWCTGCGVHMVEAAVDD